MLVRWPYVLFFTAMILGFYLAFYFILIGGTAALLKFWERFILDRDNVKYSGPEDGLAWTPGMMALCTMEVLLQLLTVR